MDTENRKVIVRQSFDLQEAAVLLDVYLTFRDKDLNISKSAEIASYRLRELAQKRGMLIDKSFRSSMGLQGRLRSLKNVYEGKESPTPSTKVFHEVVNLYRNDPEKYQSLLVDAGVSEIVAPSSRHTQKKRKTVKKTKFVKNLKDKALQEHYGKDFSNVYYALKTLTKRNLSASPTEIFLFLDRKVKRKDICEILKEASWSKETKNSHYRFFDKEKEKKEQKMMENSIIEDEQEFLDWLPIAFAPSDSDKIRNSYKSINALLIQKKLLAQPLASTKKIGQVEDVLHQVKKTFTSKKARLNAQKLLTAYLMFLREEKGTNSEEVELPVEIKEDWVRFNFKNMKEFERTIPAYCAIDGNEIIGKNWARIFVGIIEQEIKKENPALNVLYSQPLLSSRNDYTFFMESKIEGLNCSKLTNGYWVNVNYSIPVLMEQIRAFCLHCGYNKSQVVIYGMPKENNVESLRNSGISMEEAENFIKTKGLEGATVQEVIYKILPRAAVTPTKIALDNDINLITLPGKKYVHVEAFVDLDEAEKILESILQTHFVQFGGYSNNKLLYGAAEHDLSMFLNDNDCADQDSVYALAQYFFDKKRNKDKFVFSFPHIFEKEPDYPLTLKGLMINLARINGGVLNATEAENYLQNTMLSYGGLNQLLQTSISDTFLLYDKETYLLSENLGTDEQWKQNLHVKLETLFQQENVAYIIPRDIDQSWLKTLLILPHDLSWTILLLQDVLRHNPDIGFRPIKARINQSADTIAAAIVPIDSQIISFPDVVSLFMQEHYNLPVRMSCNELREVLCKAGMLEGRELIYSLPDALHDYRFSWTDENKTVLIRDN